MGTREISKYVSFNLIANSETVVQILRGFRFSKRRAISIFFTLNR